MLGEQGVITTTVRDELQVGEELGLIPRCDWGSMPVVELTSNEELLFEKFAEVVDFGEASCLAVAVSRNATVVSDDQFARRVAKKTGVPVTGTLGILKRLVVEGYLAVVEVNELLAQMIEDGYYSPVQDIRQILDSE
jgi:predicted nucleic acid-binding protein